MSDSQSSQDQIKQYLDLLNQQIRQPAAMPTGTPDDGSSPSWTGLLGRALSGGQAPGYQLRGSQADTSGNRALLNFGINTLLASGPHAVRPDLLSSLATGLQGAQESLGQDQARAGALAGAQYTAARQQQQDRMAALKEALPLLTLQQKSAAIAGTKPPWETGAPGTTGDTSGGFTGDKTKDLALIAQRESGGNPTILNHVAQEDPTAYARGATASGKYQIVNSTWAEGLKLAGLDPAQYARAMDAPEAVQDQVASALYDKHGSTPWQKGAKDWVKDEQGRYQLATVRPQAAPGGTPPPAAPGGGVAARTGGTNVAGPGAGTPAPTPASAPALPTATPDLVGPRPLPPTGGGAPVATPATLANTPAPVAPVQTPPAPAAPAVPAPAAVAPPAVPAGPPPATPESVPDTFEEYQRQHPIMVPPNVQELFKTKPNAAALGVLQQQEQNFRSEWLQAKADMDPAAMAKATEAINTVRAKQAELIQSADKQGGDAQAKYLADQTNIQKEIWQRARDAKEARITAATTQKNALDLEAAKTENQYTLDDRKKLGTERDQAQSNLDDLQMVRLLSQNAGDPRFLDTLAFGGKPVRQWLYEKGWGTQDQLQHWGAMEALSSGINKMALGLRSGISMGNLSDRDLDFIRSMPPGMLQNEDTRNSIMAMLTQSNLRKMRFADDVNDLWDGGANGMTWGRAKREVQKRMPDYVPTVPAEYSGWANPQKQQWFQDHVPANTLYRDTNGDLRIAPDPKDVRQKTPRVGLPGD